MNCFLRLGLPPQARDEFSAVLIQGEICYGILWYGQASCRDKYVSCLNATWFTVSGTPVLTEARKGSRPGDSTADLLILNRLSAPSLHGLGQGGGSGCCQPLGVEWGPCSLSWWFGNALKSSNFLVLSGRTMWPSSLVASTRLRRLFAIHTDHPWASSSTSLIIAGMSPNLGKSKTEILFDLRGPGSTPIRKHFAFNGYRLPTISKHMLSYVNIVGAYKHLGTWVQVNGKLNKELSCRFAIGHSTMTKYKSAIFANRHLPLSRKTHLFQSLVLTAVLFNSPAWYLQRKKDVEKFHSGIMSLYRRLATAHFGLLVRHWRDELVQARLSVPPPITLLHQDRLRYLQHLVRQGDDAVWAALQQHGYWWSMVDLSLTWLKNNVMKPLPELPVANNWTLWVPLLSAPGGAWKSLIRRAVIHDTLQTRLPLGLTFIPSFVNSLWTTRSMSFLARCMNGTNLLACNADSLSVHVRRGVSTPFANMAARRCRGWWPGETLARSVSRSFMIIWVWWIISPTILIAFGSFGLYVAMWNLNPLWTAEQKLRHVLSWGHRYIVSWALDHQG